MWVVTPAPVRFVGLYYSLYTGEVFLLTNTYRGRIRTRGLRFKCRQKPHRVSYGWSRVEASRQSARIHWQPSTRELPLAIVTLTLCRFPDFLRASQPEPPAFDQISYLNFAHTLTEPLGMW